MGKRGPKLSRRTERIIDDLRYHPEFTNDLMPLRWGVSREYIRQICNDYLGISLKERKRRIQAGIPIYPNMVKPNQKKVYRRYAKIKKNEKQNKNK